MYCLSTCQSHENAFTFALETDDRVPFSPKEFALGPHRPAVWLHSSSQPVPELSVCLLLSAFVSVFVSCAPLCLCVRLLILPLPLPLSLSALPPPQPTVSHRRRPPPLRPASADHRSASRVAMGFCQQHKQHMKQLTQT